MYKNCIFLLYLIWIIHARTHIFVKEKTRLLKTGSQSELFYCFFIARTTMSNVRITLKTIPEIVNQS